MKNHGSYYFLISFIIVAPVFLPLCFTRPVSKTPSQQNLNVEVLLRETTSKHHQMKSSIKTLSEKDHSPSWSLDILHRDVLHGMSPNASLPPYHQRFAERITRDCARVKAMQANMQKKLSNNKEPIYEVEAEFDSGVVSGLGEGSGEYFTRIGVGTPVREQYMVLDTGSDVSWVQCLPCSKCYPQQDPIYNPFASASFSTVGCGSAVCSQLGGTTCREESCIYSVSYGDGSETEGTFAMERMTFGRTVVQNVAMGCGHENAGLFVGASGLLGLGAGPFSFTSQIKGPTGGMFSYCLTDRYSDSYGRLIFGPSAMTVGSVVTPMLKNPVFPSFYYVSLAGIIVGGSVVPLPASTFEVEESGTGGVIIDSGTSVTRLRKEAYEAVRDTFVSHTTGLPRTTGSSLFDTCYSMMGLRVVSLPTVGFYFSNGATIVLAARSYMIAVDSMGTFCFAFAPTTSGPSIIGNIQQQHIRVSFDTLNSLIGFAPNEC